MRNNILCFATAALLMMTGAAQAITYNVNRTIGAGSVTGFIETDSTLGILNPENITDWVLTLAAPNLKGGSPDVISHATQNQTYMQGIGLTATTTQILFNFDEAGSIFVLQGGSDNFWCIGAIDCFGINIESMGYDATVFTATQSASRQGQIVIASISAIPLPLGLPLFAGGLGLLGILGWHRKRKGKRNLHQISS